MFTLTSLTNNILIIKLVLCLVVTNSNIFKAKPRSDCIFPNFWNLFAIHQEMFIEKHYPMLFIA